MQVHTHRHTNTHTDEWLQLDGETKHVRTEESWGAPTALWSVCVYVFHLHLAVFFFSSTSLWCPVHLNIRSSAPVAEQQLWLGEQRKQSSPKQGRGRTASLPLCKKNELLMRPQLEQKHPGILGNGHNRTSKGVYRKTNGKRALKIKKKKSTHTRFSNFLYFCNKRSSFEKNKKINLSWNQ